MGANNRRTRMMKMSKGIHSSYDWARLAALGIVLASCGGSNNSNNETCSNCTDGGSNGDADLAGSDGSMTSGDAAVPPAGNDASMTSDDATAPLPPTKGAPYVAYTDIVSGPGTGGEGNNGVYLSLFGVNFGGDMTKVSVTVGGGAVARVVYLGASNGRPDIEQLSVQLGAAAKTGAIQVTVNGVASNTDQTFTVSPGNIYFVDNNTALTHGLTSLPSDTNAGTITAPFRHVQFNGGAAGAMSKVKPGDFVVMRGYSGTYAEAPGCSASKPCLWGVGYSGTDVGTSATAAVTLMGYPGEVPFADLSGVAAQHGGVFAWDDTVANDWVNIVGIRLEAAGTQGAIDTQTHEAYWRVVNDDISMTSAGSGTNEGAIGGDAVGQFWVGNHIHDTAGGSSNQTHGIYVDGEGSFEVAYNWVENIHNGTGIQLYGDNGPDGNPTVITDAHVHHNIVHDTLKYGINIANGDDGASGSLTNIAVWNNLVYNTGLPGLIFNYLVSTSPLVGALIYNNTFFNVCTTCAANNAGAISNDNGSVLTSSSASFVNNIVVPHAGVNYISDESSGLSSIMASTNLWSGGKGSTLGTGAITGTPVFVSAPAAMVASGGALPDMHLMAGSPGLGAGSTAVATGNGVAGKINLPAFTGVITDLDLIARPSTGIDVGCTQH